MPRRTGLVLIVALAALTMYPPPAQVGVRDAQAAPLRPRRSAAAQPVGDAGAPADPGRAVRPPKPAPRLRRALPSTRLAYGPAPADKLAARARRVVPWRRPVPSGALPPSRPLKASRLVSTRHYPGRTPAASRFSVESPYMEIKDEARGARVAVGRRARATRARRPQAAVGAGAAHLLQHRRGLAVVRRGAARAARMAGGLDVPQVQGRRSRPRSRSTRSPGCR